MREGGGREKGESHTQDKSCAGQRGTAVPRKDRSSPAQGQHEPTVLRTQRVTTRFRNLNPVDGHSSRLDQPEGVPSSGDCPAFVKKD